MFEGIVSTLVRLGGSDEKSEPLETEACSYSPSENLSRDQRASHTTPFSGGTALGWFAPPEESLRQVSQEYPHCTDGVNEPRERQGLTG